MQDFPEEDAGAPVEVDPRTVPLIGATAPRAAALREYQVIGERCSGTNYLDHLMARNFALERSRLLGWKHGFPVAAAIPPRLLVIVVVRNALDWVRSLYARPWHASPRMKALPFEQFLREPWDSVVQKPEQFQLPKGSGVQGAALQADRHPIDGTRFENVLALRRAKLAAQLGYLNRGVNAVCVSHEALVQDPGAVCAAIAARFDLAAPDPFRDASGQFGWRGPRPAAPGDMPPRGLAPADRRFVTDSLDLALEARLGYRYR